MQELIQLIEAEMERDDIPNFQAGDTVNVHVTIREGGKERIQQYKGVVLQRKGNGATKTFTVRKISNGIGVERIFPVNSPSIAKIDVLKRGVVRRAKLFYLRERAVNQQGSKKEDNLVCKTDNDFERLEVIPAVFLFIIPPELNLYFLKRLILGRILINSPYTC